MIRKAKSKIILKRSFIRVLVSLLLIGLLSGHVTGASNVFAGTILDDNDITSAMVEGMVAPVAGETPVTKSNLAASNGPLTVTELTWLNSDDSPATLTNEGKFKVNSTYKARILLTSISGWKFPEGGLTPSIDVGTPSQGTLITSENSIENQLVFDVTFDPTESKMITQIYIYAQPSKLTYYSGEALNLHGMVLTLRYNDGTSENKTFEDLVQESIFLTSPENGTILSKAISDRRSVEVMYGSYVTSTNKLTVNDAPQSSLAVTSYLPANNAVANSLNDDLELEFNEDVVAVQGKKIYLKNVVDDSIVETIDAANTDQVWVSGSTVKIIPGRILLYSSNYYVEIEAGAFKSEETNADYAGIQGKSTWNFTTELKSVVPAFDSIEFAAYFANAHVATINLLEETTYQFDGGTVSRNLTINGNGAIIEAGAGVDDDVIRSDGFIVNKETLPNYMDVKSFLKVEGVESEDVTESTLILQDLTLQNGTNPLFTVINVKTGGTLIMDNVEISGFHNNPVVGDNLSFGIHAEPGAASTTITNSTFNSSNAFRNAVAIRNGELELSGNTFEGTIFPERLRQADGYEYAIYIYGGTGSIRDNTITGYDSTTQKGYASAGISVIGFYPTEVTIEDNILNYNESGISISRTWQPYTQNMQMIVNGKVLTTNEIAYELGEAIKAANEQMNVDVSLDQSDVTIINAVPKDYQAVMGGYRSPILYATEVTSESATLAFPSDAAMIEVMNSAYSIGFQYQMDNDSEWESTEHLWVTTRKVASLSLEQNHTYRIRARLDHIKDSANRDNLRTYSNPVVIVTVTANDDTNTINGLNTTMEYKIDDDAYVKYDGTNAPDLSGTHTVKVRVYSGSPGQEWPETTLQFTTNPSEAPSFAVNAIDPSGAENDGKTQIMNVEPVPSGYSLKYYNFGTGNVIVPMVGDNPEGYTQLPAGGLITAKNGDKIGIVMIDDFTGKVAQFGQTIAVVTDETEASGLTVTSSDPSGAGNDGKTKVTVAQSLPEGHRLVYYNFGSGSVSIPMVGDLAQGYITLPEDGIIISANGDRIGIAEIDAVGKVVRFGQTTAVVTAEPSTTPTSPGSNSPSPSAPSSPSTPLPSNPAAAEGVEILVNGKAENAGKATTTVTQGTATTTIAIDPAKLQAKLDAEGERAVVTIPVKSTSDVIVGELNGQMVKNMEDRSATLVLKTDKASYTLPAEQINIDAISSQLGGQLKLEDIKVRISIAETSGTMAQVVKNTEDAGRFTIVAPALDFKVTGEYDGKTTEVTQFNEYIERRVALPDGIDPSKITTGVVVDPDGTVRHVPTKVEVVEGKYYAVINSLTNSTYSVVWHPVEFSDVANHWAKDAVNNMGSRMVIDGVGNGMFSPDTDITRAEFAAIIVRGLGLKLGEGANPFSDVAADAWYAGAVQTASTYDLITGFEDGTFRPNDKITREQAMTIIAKAMKLTGLADKLDKVDSHSILAAFTDGSSAGNWAKESIAITIQASIVNGKDQGKLEPAAYVSRAEVAALIQRLLSKSDLI